MQYDTNFCKNNMYMQRKWHTAIIFRWKVLSNFLHFQVPMINIYFFCNQKKTCTLKYIQYINICKSVCLKVHEVFWRQHPVSPHEKGQVTDLSSGLSGFFFLYQRSSAN